METKNIKAKTVISTSLKTSLKNMSKDCEPVLGQLMMAIEKSTLKTAGPIEFIYMDVSEDVEEVFNLEIVQPIDSSETTSLEGFETKEISEFKCVSHIHKGSFEHIYAVYEKLFSELNWDGQKNTNQVREVYEKWESISSEQNIVEIQIGIN